jgi:hypothetical protein
MKTAPSTPGAPRHRGRAPALCIALFLGALLVSPARAAPPVTAPSPTCAVLGARTFWPAVEWALGSQRRMLQVATVGMCLALYIIWWRK